MAEANTQEPPVKVKMEVESVGSAANPIDLTNASTATTDGELASYYKKLATTIRYFFKNCHAERIPAIRKKGATREERDAAVIEFAQDWFAERASHNDKICFYAQLVWALPEKHMNIIASRFWKW